jgi:hypothetical protein
VYRRANRGCVGLALALAGLLAGCSGEFESGWFSKPLNLSGSGLSYTYSDLGDTKLDRKVTANDLVDANGACPQSGPVPQTNSVNPDPNNPNNPNNPAADLGTAAELRGGIGIGMTECEVVSRLGAPSSINLGREPNSERTAVMSFQGGQRPGLYRFVGGRLTEMDQVAQAAPPPQPEKPVKPAKKKRPKAQPAKTKQPPATGGTNAPPSSPGTGASSAWPGTSTPAASPGASAPPAWPDTPQR